MEFENNLFKIACEKQPGCQITFSVFVKPEATNKAYKRAIKTVNKEISVPGFRKGKAPDESVIQKYGVHIDREWKEILLNDAFQAAMDLSKIYPMGKESVQKPKLDSCSLEEGAKVTVSYEYFPEVPDVDFSKLSLPSIKRQNPTEEKLKGVLEEVRKANADWEDVTGRAVQEGDFVDLTIDATNEEPPHNIVKDRRFEVAAKKMTMWLKDLLIGKNVGDVFEGVSEADPDADESIKSKFKPTPVRITLHAIKKILLPELNDDLAKKAGADSVADLESKIRANLETEADEELKEKQLQAIRDALFETFPFDLPRSILKKELEWRLERKLAAHPNHTPEDEKHMEAEAASEAAKVLSLLFINKRIEKQANIVVSNQELNEELMRTISRNPSLFNKEMGDDQSRRLINNIAADLLEKKIQEHVLTKVLELSR